MYFFKFQVACLAITIYVAFMYIKDSNQNTSLKVNPFYKILIILAPFAIFFDGLTAWTVNYLDTVPLWINYTGHAFFFLSMNAILILSYFYVINLISYVKKNKKRERKCIIYLIITSLAIIAFLPQLEFIAGAKTNYSMGISVIICYVSVLLHYVFILTVLFKNIRRIEKRKVAGTVSFLLLGFTCLLLQVVFPEILLTALFTTFLVLGIYMNAENPAIIRVQHFNENMVINFATIVEGRDDSTGGHVKRTQKYVEIILSEMLKEQKYKNNFSVDYVKNIKSSAPLHDLGKISTPDSILQKPGRLTPEEFEIMKEHAAKGGELVKKIFHDMNENEFEKVTYEVARYHHEKWNGKGYPEGLSGTQIPLHARIMSIADVFDAVSAKRCYRDALPLQECFQIIEKGSGSDFDPELVAYFLKAKSSIEDYYNSTKSS